MVGKIDNVDFEVAQESNSSDHRESGAPPVLLICRSHTGLGIS